MKWNGWYDKGKGISVVFTLCAQIPVNASLFSTCQYEKSIYYTEWKAKSIHSDSSLH